MWCLEETRLQVCFPCARMFTGSLGEIEAGVEIVSFDETRGG